MRKGYTLVEALTSIFVLAIGLLALTAIILAGIINLQLTARRLAVQECSDKAASILTIIFSGPKGSILANKLANQQFLWVYQPPYQPPRPLLTPPLPQGFPIEKAENVDEYLPPGTLLGLVLDIQGPYQKSQIQGDARPFLTGSREWPPDPPRYTYAMCLRAVPGDQTRVDVSVVLFEDYDSTDPDLDPYAINASLTRGQYTLASIDPNTPKRGVILDGQNGYVYRLAFGEVGPGPARANTSTIIVLPRAVEVLELGIIAVR